MNYLQKLKKLFILIGFIITIGSTFLEEMSNEFGVYNICFWIYMVFELDFSSKLKKEVMNISGAIKENKDIVIRTNWVFIHYFLRICLFVLITYFLNVKDFTESEKLWNSIYIILIIVQIISIFSDFPLIKERYSLIKSIRKRKK